MEKLYFRYLINTINLSKKPEMTFLSTRNNQKRSHFYSQRHSAIKHGRPFERDVRVIGNPKNSHMISCQHTRGYTSKHNPQSYMTKSNINFIAKN